MNELLKYCSEYWPSTVTVMTGECSKALTLYTKFTIDQMFPVANSRLKMYQAHLVPNQATISVIKTSTVNLSLVTCQIDCGKMLALSMFGPGGC